jgi:hypothetical protein
MTTPLRPTTAGRALAAEARDVAAVAVRGTRRTPTSPAVARSCTDTSGTRHAASHRPRRTRCPSTRPSAPRHPRRRQRPSTDARTEVRRGGEGRPTGDGNGMALRGRRERGGSAAGQWCDAAASPQPASGIVFPSVESGAQTRTEASAAVGTLGSVWVADRWDPW